MATNVYSFWRTNNIHVSRPTRRLPQVCKYQTGIRFERQNSAPLHAFFHKLGMAPKIETIHCIQPKKWQIFVAPKLEAINRSKKQVRLKGPRIVRQNGSHHRQAFISRSRPCANPTKFILQNEGLPKTPEIGLDLVPPNVRPACLGLYNTS